MMAYESETAEALRTPRLLKHNTTHMEQTMQSVPESDLDSKWEAPEQFIALLDRVLLLIECIWRHRLASIDLPLQERFRDGHRALGQLRDELEARQTERVA
jgi:hypothetical protein